MNGSEDTKKLRPEPASRAAGAGIARSSEMAAASSLSGAVGLTADSSASGDASGESHATRPEDAAASAKSRSGISRREFARRAAMASAIASLAPVQATTVAAEQSPTPASAAPQSSTPPAQTTPSPNAPQAAPDANFPKLTPEGQAEVDARVQSILGQYGARLSEEQKADVRRLCAWAQPPLDRLRAYHLQNADGEALYLKPLVEREKKPPTPPTAKPAVRKP